MKKKLTIQILGALLVSSSVVADTQNSCNNLIGCEKKICQIEENIVVAKKMENKSRVKGLEVSLEKVNKYCTNDKLIEDLEDLEDKIKDTEKDLQEDIEDYEKALEDNKADKIEKYKSKMSKEKSEIRRLKQELEELK